MFIAKANMFLVRSCSVALFAVLAVNAMAQETLRQTRAVTVDGQRETWSLIWSGPVTPVCAATDVRQAATCPCAGFAYGEQGQLFLERQRAGAATERLNLYTLFEEQDNPADTGKAALPRFPRNPADPSGDGGNGSAFAAQAATRAPVDVMQLADFSSDGMQTTFLLQVGNVPCGKREMVLIGVSKQLPRLHAFTTITHPERPLVLQDGAWTALLAGRGEARFTDWACGDHGSVTTAEKIIHAHGGTLAVRTDTYACKATGSRGQLLSSEEE